MKIIEMNEVDMINLKNLVVAMQAKIEFNKLAGPEVRALSQAIEWLEKTFNEAVTLNPTLGASGQKLDAPTAPNVVPMTNGAGQAEVNV